MLTSIEVKMENNLLKIDLLKLKWLNQHSCSSTEFLNQNLRQIGQVDRTFKQRQQDFFFMNIYINYAMKY